MKRKIILGVIGLCLVMIAGTIFTVTQQSNPLETVTLGLENLGKAESFSYSLTQQQMVNGQNRLLARINGYKSGEDIHIQGQLAGSEVEMIKIGQTLYNKDPFSKQWIKFNDVSVVQKVFLVELDPLATLQLKEIGEVMLKGEAEIDGKKCKVYTLKPSVQNQVIERFWTDFDYTLYVTKSGKTVSKAEVKAINKETKEQMTIDLEFKDIGRRISIQPPEVAK